MDAWFVYLDIRLKNYLGARYHLGAAYIRAFLGRHGIRCQQYLAGPTRSLDAIADDLSDSSPAFVGFTVFDRNFHVTRVLAEKVRKRLPKALIVAGGPTATFSYELLLRSSSAFDICVLHHGEEPALSILHTLLSGETSKLAQIPRLAIREGHDVVLTASDGAAPDGQEVIHRVEFPLVHGTAHDGVRDRNLDRYPSPYLSGSIPPTLAGEAGVVTARGCPFRCSYCNFSAMSTRSVEYHSIERTIAELSAIDRSMTERPQRLRIEFFDDVFTLNRKRTLALCKAIEGAKFRNLTFWCETRADLVDEELLEHLARAGISEMNFGLESTDAEVLSAIHKLRRSRTEFLSDIRRAVTGARAVGIAPFVSLIFGLPEETPESARRTLDFIATLPLEGYSHNFLQVEPGTELWHTHDKYGIKVSQGPQILPYRTTHAYDVHGKVLVQSHRMSLERMTRSAHALLVAQGLSGSIRPREPDEPLSLVVLTGSVETEILAHEGWTTALGPSTAVTLVKERVRSVDYDRWLSEAARFDLPVFRIDVAQPDGEGFELYDDQPALDAPVEYRLRSLNPEHERNKDAVEQYGAVLTFQQISTRLQPELAANWIVQTAESSPMELGEKTLELSCRYACRTCPAASFSAAWVDDQGVRPCPPAPARPIRPLKDLATSENLKYADEMRRRGCSACEVKETCPKCMYTAPLEPSQYCRIQKRGLMLSAALLLEIARLISRTSSETDSSTAGSLRLGRLLSKGTRLLGHWRITTQLATASRGASSWILYDADNSRMWNVPEAVSLFLELAGTPELETMPTAESLARSLEHIGVASVDNSLSRVTVKSDSGDSIFA